MMTARTAATAQQVICCALLHSALPLHFVSSRHACGYIAKGRFRECVDVTDHDIEAGCQNHIVYAAIGKADKSGFVVSSTDLEGKPLQEDLITQEAAQKSVHVLGQGTICACVQHPDVPSITLPTTTWLSRFH